jgi:hypothetical protein
MKEIIKISQRMENFQSELLFLKQQKEVNIKCILFIVIIVFNVK